MPVMGRFYNRSWRTQLGFGGSCSGFQREEESPWIDAFLRPSVALLGPGSRTLSGVLGSTYYNSFQGQNQQPAGFRQSQQPSQHYGPLSGYPNFYHSQSSLSLDHQQQMSRDGSQGQPAKQTQQN